MKRLRLATPLLLIGLLCVSLCVSACQDAEQDPPPETVPELSQTITNRAGTISVRVPAGWTMTTDTATLIELAYRADPTASDALNQFLSIHYRSADPTLALDQVLYDYLQSAIPDGATYEDINGRNVARLGGLVLEYTATEEIPAHLDTFAFVEDEQVVVVMGVNYDRASPRLFEAILATVIITPP